VSQLLSKPVSELLEKWQAGDPEALEALLPLVYNELRRLARRDLRKERPDHTLQSTELAHEAYLRLTRQEALHFENRTHFFAISAELMRQVLVEHARRRNAAKAGWRVQGHPGLRGIASKGPQRKSDRIGRCLEGSCPAGRPSKPDREVAFFRWPDELRRRRLN